MSVIDKRLKVISSSDPTKEGISGVVVLETMKTLLLQTGSGLVMVEKIGTAFQQAGSDDVLVGSDLAGRLEDRLGRMTS